MRYKIGLWYSRYEMWNTRYKMRDVRYRTHDIRYETRCEIRGMRWGAEGQAVGYNASDMKREWRGVRLVIRCETGVGGNARPGVRPIKNISRNTIFNGFACVFNGFECVFHWCPMGCLLFNDFPWVCRLFSMGFNGFACFPMISNWFACFFNGCVCVFHWCPMVLPAFQWFSMGLHAFVYGLQLFSLRFNDFQWFSWTNKPKP